MPSCRGGGVTVNSFQMNSVHLTEAGSGTVERCLDSRGQMHVRNQVGKLRIDSETGDMIHENTVGSIRFRTDSTGTVMEHLL